MKSGRQRRLVSPVCLISLLLHLFSESLFIGVKSYPRGVTTNSDGGIESYETYYPIFEAMQEVDMVLNLHGEVPSDADTVSPSAL